MNCGVIGVGGIGNKRIDAIIKLKEENPKLEIDNIFVYDPSVLIDKRREDVLWMKDADWVAVYCDLIIISTPHDIAEKYLIDYIGYNKSILVEKPFCRTYEKAKIISKLIDKWKENVFVGFNYRFYKGVNKLLEDIKNDKFGELISVNMVLGHGGKESDINSWKLLQNAGDGCLLDPGIHMLDLLYKMFGNNINPLSGKVWKNFWNTGINEEINLLMESNDTIINLQTSIVKWNNTFEIKVNGSEGYGTVIGRGGNYGVMKYWTGKRWAWNKDIKQKDTEKLVCIDDCNDSFYLELKNILEHLKDNKKLIACNSNEALNVMNLYDSCLEVIK
jgi:predicted dehydrogenase